MTLLIPPSWLQALYVLKLQDDTEAMLVTCGHQITASSPPTGTAMANRLMTDFGTKVVEQLMSNAYQLREVVVYEGTDGVPLVSVSSLAPYFGTGVSPVIPQNSAYLIRKRTDLAGRRGRGRMYLPSVIETVVDAKGDLTIAWRGTVQEKFNDWYTALTTAGTGGTFPPAVLHRSEGAGFEPPPTLVTTFVVDQRIATQRRRLRP